MPDKKKEIIRFGIGDGMTVDRFKKMLDAAGAVETDTVRHYNGSIIVERDAAE